MHSFIAKIAIVLTADQLDRVSVVLVRARNPNNIGAVARAMHDLGFTDLRLVNEFTVPLEAARSAIDAGDLLGAAREFSDVADAVADCTLVFGTTAVGERALEHPLQALASASERIHRELGEDRSETRVALLFGSEKTGLSNDELSHCDALLTIPMQSHDGLRHPSMNLGQAVAVCLYELVRDRGAIGTGRSRMPADASTRERLTMLLAEVLKASEYTRHHPANSRPDDLRRLVHRLEIDAADGPVWLGMLRQILWKLGGERRSL